MTTKKFMGPTVTRNLEGRVTSYGMFFNELSNPDDPDNSKMFPKSVTLRATTDGKSLFGEWISKDTAGNNWEYGEIAIVPAKKKPR